MRLEQMLSCLRQSTEVLSFCLISPWPLLTLPESTMEAGLGGTRRDPTVSPVGRHRMASVPYVHSTSRIESASREGELQQPCKVSAACRVRRQQAAGLGRQYSLFSSTERSFQRSWIQILPLKA